jgi:hypothetical protein
MVLLPPEKEDSVHLVDKEDDLAFSHFMVDHEGKLYQRESACVLVTH